MDRGLPAQARNTCPAALQQTRERRFAVTPPRRGLSSTDPMAAFAGIKREKCTLGPKASLQEKVASICPIPIRLSLDFGLQESCLSSKCRCPWKRRSKLLPSCLPCSSHLLSAGEAEVFQLPLPPQPSPNRSYSWKWRSEERQVKSVPLC